MVLRFCAFLLYIYIYIYFFFSFCLLCFHQCIHRQMDGILCAYVLWFVLFSPSIHPSIEIDPHRFDSNLPLAPGTIWPGPRFGHGHAQQYPCTTIMHLAWAPVWSRACSTRWSFRWARLDPFIPVRTQPNKTQHNTIQYKLTQTQINTNHYTLKAKDPKQRCLKDRYFGNT